jgi:hypothetical protein
VAPEANVRTDATGEWSVVLYANAAITPANTYYQVTHVIADQPDQVVKFVVPDDAGDHALADLIV